MMATPLQGLTRSISAHRVTPNVKSLTHHANYLYDMNKRHSVGKCRWFKTIATSMPGLGAVLTFTLIALISATELKYSNPGSTIGGQLDVVWKRDKQCNA
jgi:hypothetical protein